jgi:hypothetical protein
MALCFAIVTVAGFAKVDTLARKGCSRREQSTELMLAGQGRDVKDMVRGRRI